jgi:hypothetical protein
MLVYQILQWSLSNMPQVALAESPGPCACGRRIRWNNDDPTPSTGLDLRRVTGSFRWWRFIKTVFFLLVGGSWCPKDLLVTNFSWKIPWRVLSNSKNAKIWAKAAIPCNFVNGSVDCKPVNEEYVWWVADTEKKHWVVRIIQECREEPGSIWGFH